MKSLFRQMDSDGDELEVETGDSYPLHPKYAGTLLFHTVRRTGGGASAALNREGVLELIDVLTTWADDNAPAFEEVTNPFEATAEETALRTVIREEIARALNILGHVAGDHDGYETGELESAGLSAVGKSAEYAIKPIKDGYHDGRCNLDYGGTCGPRCETNWEKS